MEDEDDSMPQSSNSMSRDSLGRVCVDTLRGLSGDPREEEEALATQEWHIERGEGVRSDRENTRGGGGFDEAKSLRLVHLDGGSKEMRKSHTPRLGESQGRRAPSEATIYF